VRPAPFSLPRPVEREVAVSAGGRIYLAGGLDAAGASVSGVYALDPGSGALQAIGALPQPFHDAAGAVLGRRVVVFGGGAVEGTNNVQSIGFDGRGPSVIGHLPLALSDLGATTVNGTVYLVGGYDG